MTPLSRPQMAWRAARDLADGAYVNLGIGLPTLVADHIAPGREIVFHSENGILGLGRAPAPEEADPDLINAGKGAASLLPGGAFFHHADAFEAGPYQIGRTVGRTIVDDDHLVTRIIELLKRLQARERVVDLSPIENDDTDARIAPDHSLTRWQPQVARCHVRPHSEQG